MAQQTHGTRMGGRGAAGMMPGEKAKNFKGTMAKLLRYLGSHLPAIVACLVLSIDSGRRFFMLPSIESDRPRSPPSSA